MDQQLEVIEFDVPDECREISLEAIRDLPAAQRFQCESCARALGYELASIRDTEAWWHEYDGLKIRVVASGLHVTP
jgi:hypothetical protein